MIMIDGKYQSANMVVGPWTTDQEIKTMIKGCNQKYSFEELSEMRTGCREYLAQADANFRSPYTTQ